MNRELYQKFTWNTTYYTWLEEKNRSTESNFFQPFCCVLRSDTRQTDPFAVCQHVGHTANLTSIGWPLLERLFAVCLMLGTRQR